MFKKLCLYLIMALFLTACTISNDEFTEDDFVIYTSIYPIQYIVEEIVGDLAIVKSIYPPGADAHTYEPTSKEITTMARSDVFIYLGAGMESFVETTAKALANQDLVFVEVGKNETLFSESDEETHEHHGHHHHDLDPHIWFDPLRMIEMANIVTEELSQLKPELAEVFRSNLQQLNQNLESLDKEFLVVFENRKNASIIVSHAAYGYWEERYGIKQIPVVGLTTSEEPSQKELVTIAKEAKKSDVKYVIFEQNSTNKITKIIQEYIGAEPLNIHNLEMLTDEDIKNHEDYLSLMRKNLATLKKATEKKGDVK